MQGYYRASVEYMFAHLWHWKVIRGIWMGLACDLHANTCIFLHFTQFRIVSHCGGIGLSTEARMLLITLKFPNFAQQIVRCAHAVLKDLLRNGAVTQATNQPLLRNGPNMVQKAATE